MIRNLSMSFDIDNLNRIRNWNMKMLKIWKYENNINNDKKFVDVFWYW
jgi:hypothetical protein